MRGRVRGQVGAYRVDLARQELQLDDAVLRARDLDLWMGDADAELAGWWADVRAPRLSFSLHDNALSARDVAVRCRDAEPMLELFAAADALPAWASDVFHLPNFRARATVQQRRGTLSLQLRATAEAAALDAALRHDGALDAAALVRLGPLSAAVQVQNGDTRIVPLAGAGWLREQKAALSRASHAR